MNYSKIKNYFRYYSFIKGNWSFRLAVFTLYHELKGEKKYQIDTIGIDRLQDSKIESKHLPHASMYQGVNFYILEKAFDYLKNLNALNNIVDFGSGKGRVMAVAAFYGCRNITGVDFATGLCREAEINIAGIKHLYPSTGFNIICEDAVNYKIENESEVFFFFNPFDEVVMLKVVKNILSSLRQNSRQIYIVYVNPLHKEIFLSAGFKEEYYLMKLNYIELSILSNDPDEY